MLRKRSEFILQTSYAQKNPAPPGFFYAPEYVKLQDMNFVTIRAYDNYIYANMKLSLLQEHGINCHLKDEFTVTIDPLLNPAIGGIKLMVAEPQEQRAQQILHDTELEWLQTVPCPVCRQEGFRKEVIIKEFPSLWGKLKSMLANGQETEVNTVYTCLHCGAEFDDLEGVL